MKQTINNILGALDPKEKKRFTFLILLDIFINLLDIISIVILLWIIRFYLQPTEINHLNYLPAWLTDPGSIALIACFVLLFCLKNLAGYFISRAQFRFNSEIAVNISRQKMLHFQRSVFNDYINTDSSAHIRNISFQPFDFCQYMLSGLQQIITQFTLVSLTIVAVILFNATIFLLLMAVLLPPVVIVFYFIRNRMLTTKQAIQQSNEKSFQYLLDALKGFVESNIYNKNDFFLKRYLTFRKKFSTQLFDSFALQQIPGRVIEIFAMLGLFVLIAIAKWNPGDNNDLLLTIAAFVAAAYKIIPGVVKIINITGQMKAYEFSIVNREQVPEENVIGLIKDSLTPITSIKLSDLHFTYHNQKILQGLSASFETGDFVGIFAESGKGKTTLFNLLLGFLSPKSGTIAINGEILLADEIKKYWPSISYVKQQSFFIHDTILKNISFEETGQQQENLDHAIKISGLQPMLSSYPEGIEKVITENGKNISGGQQQRIAIARAIYKNTSLILLDEPFNELDDTASQTLLQNFKTMAASGKIILMITHDKKSLVHCNKIISLDA